jgi:hypothetical protein
MKQTYHLLLILLTFSYSGRLIANPDFQNQVLKPLEELSLGLLPRDEEDCILIRPDILREREAKKRLNENDRVFVDLQFIALGSNGEASLENVPLPRVNLRDFFTELSSLTGLSRDKLLEFPENLLGSIISTYYSNNTGVEKKHAIENAVTLNKLINIEDPNLFFDALQSEMKSQSFAKKVGLLANVLTYLEDNYDVSTADSGSTEDLKVSDKDLIDGIRESIRTGTPVEVGVCRHMHQFAVRMARAMGLDNAYTVGFRTTESGHRTMVLQDPSNPSRVIQLNYGKKSEKLGVTGPEALVQNHQLPSTGISLRVYNHQDELSIVLPTEEGAILNRMTGGRDSDLSPDYKSKSQIQQIGVDTPYGTVRFFHSNLSRGSQGLVSGAGIDTELKYNDLFSGKYGIAGFYSTREVSKGELKNKGVYAQTSQNFKVKVHESQNVSITGFSELKVRGNVYCVGVDKDGCLFNTDYNVSALSGVEAKYVTGPIQNRTALNILGQVEKDQSTPDMDFLFATPVTQLTHDSTFKLTSTFDGNIGGELNLYHLGPGIHGTYNGHLGLLDRKRKIKFQLDSDGRLTQNTPIWLPDAEHSVGGALGTTIFNDQLYLNLDGKKSLEIDGNYYLGIGVGGSFTTTGGK